MKKTELACNQKTWFDDKLCQFMYGGFFPDRHNKDWDKCVLSRINPGRMVAALKKAGVEVFYFYSRDTYGNCYNNTKVDYKHSALGKRDLFRELVEECKKAKIIPATTYEPFAAGRVGKEHPDWCAVRPNGKSTIDRDTPLACIHTPMRNHILNHIEEVAVNYDIRGFFADMVLYVDCYCNSCQSEFRKRFGKNLPEYEDWKNPLWKQCITWRYEETYRFLEEMRGVLKKARPGIMFTHNFYGASGHTWTSKQNTQTALLDDCVELDIFIQSVGSITYSREPRLFRSISKHRPCILMEGVCVPPRAVPKTETMFTIGAMSFITHGCSFMTGDYPNPDGTFKQNVLDQTLKANRQIQRRKPWLLNCRAIKYLGLYYSRATVDFSEPGLAESSFNGALKALVEMHVPLDILTELSLQNGEIFDYHIIYLPNIACLSDREIEIFREYVRRGGSLVADFLTSTMDEFGNSRKDVGLGEVLGIEYEGTTGEKYGEGTVGDRTFMCFQPGEKLGRELAPISDRQITVKPVASARCHGRIQKTHSVGEHIGKIFPGEITAWPAAVQHAYGKGRTLYWAANLEREYLRNSLPLLRRLIHNGIHLVSPGKPPIAVHAPLSVEMEAYWQNDPRRLVIHLLNFQSNPNIISIIKSDGQYPWYFSGGKGDIIDEVIPVHNVTVMVRIVKKADIRKIYIAPEMLPLKPKFVGGGLEVKVPELKIHSMVVIELKNSG